MGESDPEWAEVVGSDYLCPIGDSGVKTLEKKERAVTALKKRRRGSYLTSQRNRTGGFREISKRMNKIR